MTMDTGRSPSGRATHERSHSPVSPPPVGVPNAVCYLEVQADVRYWEDAIVGTEADEDGSRIPFREGDTWHPWIELDLGRVAEWPRGLTADIHYKVCDAGEYWLTTREGKRLAKWKGCYVPGAFLCHGDNGYGDYIILKVDADGFIVDWQPPSICEDDWKSLASAMSAFGQDPQGLEAKPASAVAKPDAQGPSQ